MQPEMSVEESLEAAAHNQNVAIGKSNSGVLGDKIFRLITLAAGLLVVAVVAGILVMLVVDSWPAIHKFGFGFLTTSSWDPVAQKFGALSSIFGTLVTSAIAIIIGVPVSFGVALFITELAPVWLKRPVGIAVELLAAVPSIIYGLWGLFVFAPWFGDNVEPWLSDNLGDLPVVGPLFQGPPMGIGILTAGIILSVMIIPFMAAVMREVFESVPAVLKESAYGLGATTWEVVWKVVLPFARVGTVGGIMLGLGRALGETMAVTFVIGNSHDISASLLNAGNTISSTLANEFTEASGAIYMSSLIYLGLVLFVITFVVLALAKLMLLKMNAREGKKS